MQNLVVYTYIYIFMEYFILNKTFKIAYRPYTQDKKGTRNIDKFLSQEAFLNFYFLFCDM